ncbi:hypothetical protein FRC09_015253 [Ceratobasidium sp. 395]|nr:hypothetical protein FRC09_015253 [Ceratobasidium sp. 395]
MVSEYIQNSRLPYRVEYISLPDIEPKLKELGVPPSTHNPLFKYTLPMIADPSNEPGGKLTYVTESFNIALYLDDKYPEPDYPAVFPRGTRALQSIAVDQITPKVAFAFAPVLLPLASVRTDLLDERGMEYFVRTRSAVFGTELSKLLDDAPENWKAAEAAWNSRVNAMYEQNQGGPFVMGHRVSFVDFVIGGIIYMVQKLEGGEMTYWKKMAERHGGRWAVLWEEIAKLEADSSEVV